MPTAVRRTPTSPPVPDGAGRWQRGGRNRRARRLRLPAGYVSGPEACAAAGLTYRQLHYWTEQGLLSDVDVYNPTPGSGRSTGYRATDLPNLHVRGMLSALGTPPGQADRLTHQQRLVLVGVTRKQYRYAKEAL